MSQATLLRAKVSAKYHAVEVAERLTVAVYKDEGGPLERVHIDEALRQFEKLGVALEELKKALDAEQSAELAR